MIETLVAVFVLSLSAIAALTLMVSTMETVDNVQDRVIAVNLAREGVEAVRNIRESNWLEHSRERRDYWNCLGMLSCDNSKDTNLIETDSNYIIDFDDNFRWQLTKRDTPLDLEDANLASNEDYLLVLKKDATGSEFYTHDISSLAETENTRFYRQISTRYLDDEQDIIEVKSRVEWYVSGTRVSHVELTTYLTDFLGREVTIN